MDALHYFWGQPPAAGGRGQPPAAGGTNTHKHTQTHARRHRRFLTSGFLTVASTVAVETKMLLSELEGAPPVLLRSPIVAGRAHVQGVGYASWSGSAHTPRVPLQEPTLTLVDAIFQEAYTCASVGGTSRVAHSAGPSGHVSRLRGDPSSEVASLNGGAGRPSSSFNVNSVERMLLAVVLFQVLLFSCVGVPFVGFTAPVGARPRHDAGPPRRHSRCSRATGRAGRT